MARRDPQFRRNGIYYLARTTKSTGSCGANLKKVLAHRLSVKPEVSNEDCDNRHCIERSNFINSHLRHFEYSCHLVHHTYTCPAQLPLSKIEQRYHCGLFVLRWILAVMSNPPC